MDRDFFFGFSIPGRNPWPWAGVEALVDPSVPTPSLAYEHLPPYQLERPGAGKEKGWGICFQSMPLPFAVPTEFCNTYRGLRPRKERSRTMRKHFAVLLAVLLLAGLLAGTPALAAEKAKAQEVKVGDSVTVGKLYPNVFRMRSDPMYSQLYYFGFITDAVVMNPEGIGKFKFMDECRFGHPQDRVTVVAKDPGRKRVLVKYAQNKVEDYPYCPSGTLFFVPEMEFAKVLALACKEKKEYEAERQKVKQLLGE